ncbi:MAG: galactokinase [Nocardioidaceae bacterium]
MTESPGRWQAPGRVNLIGEHLDYNGGPVLPIAINRRTVVTVARSGSTRVSARTRGDVDCVFDVTVRPGEVEGWGAYVAGVVWSLGDAGHQVPGLDIDVESDVPIGAGLSSSAALECSVAVAIRDFAGLRVDDVALALLAQRAENDFVGVPSGSMDQLASMTGRRGHAVLIDTATSGVQGVPAGWSDDGLALVVVDTRARHSLGDGQYAARRAQCEDAARHLGVQWLADADLDAAERLDDPTLVRRARHVVTETARVRAAVDALAAGDWLRLGRLFLDSHASMRDDFQISCPELDTAVAAAVRAGALGARMTGGGFGGSAIALAPVARVEAIEDACCTAFRRARFRAPHVFVVEPADGASPV